MLTAVVRHADSSLEVHLIAQDEGDEEAAESEQGIEGPSPIAPELKELAWGGGAFVVFLVAMRLFLFPRVKRGMEARYGKVRSDHQTAEDVKAAAEGEVAEYEQALVAARAEAVERIDTARRALEAERAARLEQVNAGISERRAAAVTEIEAAKDAARGSIEAAVAAVAAQASELATGQRPDDAVVRRAVVEVMGGVGAR